MQNFGRGMWRRVGDYERIQAPMLLQHSRVEQWQKFLLYQEYLKKQKQMLNSSNQIIATDDIKEEKEEK